MRNLQAFGTDGEKALANALHTVFNKAVHVRCFLHFKGNLDSRLQDLGIPKHERIEFLRDVFGNPLQLEGGLVDVDDNSFEVAVKNLELVWNTRERVFNDTSQELPQFINSMREMVVCQRKEVERAVIGIGEYRLSERFKQYSIDQSKFFLMSEKQREKSLKKFFTAQFDDSCMQGCPEFEGTVAEEQGQGESNPFVEIPSIPQYVSKKIWNESAELSNCICSSPGCKDESTWLVKSFNPSHK